MKALTQDVDLDFGGLGAACVFGQDDVGFCVLLGDFRHLQLEVIPRVAEGLAFT